MKLVRYRGKRKRTDWEGAEPETSRPFVYLLTEPGSDMPFYIGEYGKAGSYNVLSRIRRHFWKSGTLARVSNNLPRFNNDVPAEFDAYIKELDDSFSSTDKRQSLEAWLIYIACHVEKCQSRKFCVTKYSAPTEDYSGMAKNILEEFKETHNNTMQETSA
jgi:hypothetical protein